MGKFEQTIPEKIAAVDAELKKLNAELYSIDWGHDCDCEYCDRRTDENPEAEQQADEIKAQIKNAHALKQRLQKHAELHGAAL